MEAIVIITGIIVLWLLIRWEVKRNVVKILISLADKELIPHPTSKTPAQQSDENRFIFWHNKQKETKQIESDMNNELQRLKLKKKVEKPQKYAEYLEWCKQTGQTPKYKNMNAIDHCY